MSSSRRPAARVPRHSRRIRRHGALRLVATVLVGALTFVGGGAFAVYTNFASNVGGGLDLEAMRTEAPVQPDPEDGPTTEAPPTDPRAGQAINIVLIGSDSRDGENLAIGGGEEGGARSDTTLLVHVAADRSRVEAVSIPRDLLTAIPACPLDQDNLERTSGRQSSAMFNSAFSTGAAQGDVHLGAYCTALTVEGLTGLTVDEYAVVDFAGFQRMVDTIGGVPMCIPEPIVDPRSDLDLAAGQQTLDGQQALGLARARKIAGSDGSDIQRIDRQQELLAAVVRQVLSKNVVTDIKPLLDFLDAVTDSLSVSSGLANLMNLAGLATSLGSVGAGGVTFVTMPFDYAGARVVENGLSEQLWERLRNDEPIVTPEPEPEPPVVADPGAPETPVEGEGDPGAQPPVEETPDPEPTETPTQDPWTVVRGTDETIC
ncbi:LCP family protein [Litorihabitans aurantiacus]|uniref:Transcriptional regulator n=1 Tax=Litorihabitans aurantiacus TaxID=1930061 RepID=A0AA37UHF6_9MICO|nr:LCP family protein [Litorihabitans aurantiacus]GMA30609.1 transcriptional regulator [Litorihabitans aurantiacus]